MTTKRTTKKTCKYCYGKGYATALNMLYEYADFFGDATNRSNQVTIIPCMRCQKWKRSKKTRDAASAEVTKIMNALLT